MEAHARGLYTESRAPPPKSKRAQELLPHAQECRRRVDAGNADAGRLPTQQRTLLLVNGHIEVARACGADGVHLPEAMTEAAHVSELKQQQQGWMVVGGSVHSVVRRVFGAGVVS